MEQKFQQTLAQVQFILRIDFQKGVSFPIGVAAHLVVPMFEENVFEAIVG